jgi:hypothetical protein
MNTNHRAIPLGLVLGTLVAAAACRRAVPNQPPAMIFFVTSAGPGDGGNLGGLDGADAHCQKLGSAAGGAEREWRAYLSAPAAPGRPAVNARDRIGPGPWVNAKGVTVAADIRELHGNNRLNDRSSLNERGEPINETVHDILTGSTVDGMLAGTVPDVTCHGWTSDGAGKAIVGHFNRAGGGDRPSSWNSAHQTPSCSAKGFDSVGGAGLFYCFAAR